MKMSMREFLRNASFRWFWAMSFLPICPSFIVLEVDSYPGQVNVRRMVSTPSYPTTFHPFEIDIRLRIVSFEQQQGTRYRYGA